MPRPRRPKTKPAENYVPQASSASATTTKLLQKRRKDNEWQQLLELKREEFAKRMAECDARQAELKKKCKDLRKRVQTKEQEVQETRSKIDRATKKQEEEKGFQEQKDEEIKEKRLIVAQEEADYEKKQRELERTNKYKQYLDMVCEQNEGTFDEVDNILKRYESLDNTEKDLKALKDGQQETFKEESSLKTKFSKRANTDIVEKNANMAQMRSYLEQLRSQSKDQMVEAMNRMDEKQTRDKDRSSIQMAVDNLYNRCFAMDKDKMNKAKLQDLEHIKSLSDEVRICEMLVRLGVFYTDMEAISKDENLKSHPRKPDQFPTHTANLNKPKKKKDKEGTKAPIAEDVTSATAEGGNLERRNSVKQEEHGRRQSVRSGTSNSAKEQGE